LNTEDRKKCLEKLNSKVAYACISGHEKVGRALGRLMTACINLLDVCYEDGRVDGYTMIAFDSEVEEVLKEISGFDA
jgi:hypothetical protein